MGNLATVRRPPELLTRDVVAKAINSERDAGRASAHGGAYLDISWREPDQVRKKLPGMYHQFKELAAVDITTRKNGSWTYCSLCDGRNKGSS